MGLNRDGTYEEKVRICKRSNDWMVGPKIGFPPEDIIFDPNMLTVASGSSLKFLLDLQEFLIIHRPQVHTTQTLRLN